MNKCISCGSELPPETRFCGTCGAMQPDTTNVDKAENIETISSTPHAENIPANIPPPPPQPNPEGQFAQGENKPHNSNSMGQPGNPPSSPQPQTSYDDYQQPQQLQQPYSNYQPVPPPPYNYQPTPPPQQPYNYQPTQPYGDYQLPSQPGSYQPPPQPGSFQPVLPPQPSGIHTSDTFANANLGMAGTIPPKTEPQQKAPAWLKWVIIGVVAVIILAGSGLLLIHFLTPTPVITVTSDYHDNGTLAGADGTTLHVTGKQFAANSTITFLLDSTTVNTQAVSDASGNVSTNLKVTSDWPVGQHKLTAHDASNNTTNTGIAMSIVQPGHAGTPGPNGAPTNAATFKIMTVTHLQSGSTVHTYAPELDVTGQSDSQGGSVCSPGDDGSQQKNQSNGPNGTTLYEVSTYTCSGTYKEGHLTYNDTLNTDIYSDTGGSCTLTNSQPSFIQMTGDYMASHQFSGNVTINSIGADQYTCTGDLIINNSAGATGTWTGTTQ